MSKALLNFALPATYVQALDAQRVHPGVPQGMIRQLAAAAIGQGDVPFSHSSDALMRRCQDAEQFLVEAVTGAAMVLGEWCASDQIGPFTVAAGIARLEELVFDVADERLRSATRASNPYKVLLSRPANSQHTLGSYIVAEIFSWHGWAVMAGPAVKFERIADQLQVESIDVLGVTLSVDHDLLSVHRVISRCRAVSRNPDLIVMVGGTQAFLRPQLADEVNADFCATSASQAQATAIELVRQRDTRRARGA